MSFCERSRVSCIVLLSVWSISGGHGTRGNPRRRGTLPPGARSPSHLRRSRRDAEARLRSRSARTNSAPGRLRRAASSTTTSMTRTISCWRSPKPPATTFSTDNGVPSTDSIPGTECSDRPMRSSPSGKSEAAGSDVRSPTYSASLVSVTTASAPCWPLGTTAGKPTSAPASRPWWSLASFGSMPTSDRDRVRG